MKINHKEINNNKKLFKPKFLTLHYNFLICQVSPLKKKINNNNMPSFQL